MKLMPAFLHSSRLFLLRYGDTRIPDFIIYSSQFGLVIFEVKDWDLEQVVSADPQHFTLQISGSTQKRRTPLQQARDYIYRSMDKIKPGLGSGKTLILVHRAALLRNYIPDVRRVLFVCYNVTLVNYIKRLLSDKQVPLGDNGVEVMHFFQLCARICGGDVKYENENQYYYERVIQAAQEKLLDWLVRYDAVLIDEGQDFSDDMLQLFPETFGTVQGPPPKITAFSNFHEIPAYVADKTRRLADSQGYPLSEIAVLYAMKAPDRLPGVHVPHLPGSAMESRGILHHWISEDFRAKQSYDITTNKVAISTIHWVKVHHTAMPLQYCAHKRSEQYRSQCGKPGRRKRPRF